MEKNRKRFLFDLQTVGLWTLVCHEAAQEMRAKFLEAVLQATL
jgi:hypothetical protein